MSFESNLKAVFGKEFLE